MAKGFLLLAVVIVFAAVAIDLGIFFSRINKAEWEAEGLARAAANQLALNPDQADALRIARDWLTTNARDPSRGECCVFEDARPLTMRDGYVDTVTASSYASHSTFFLHYLGFPKKIAIHRGATAQVVGARGASICPWGVIGDDTAEMGEGVSYLGLVPGRVYEIDLEGGASQTGDFVSLDLARAGRNGNIAAVAAGCPRDATSVWSVGDITTLLPDSGGTNDSTLQALNDHFSFEASDGYSDYLSLGWCDVTFERDDQGAGIGHITGFNPHVQFAREECVRGTLDGGSGRLVVVPIVGRPADGAAGMRILGLATMYIASWDTKKAYGIFLDRMRLAHTELTGADDNPLAPLHVELLD